MGKNTIKEILSLRRKFKLGSLLRQGEKIRSGKHKIESLVWCEEMPLGKSQKFHYKAVATIQTKDKAIGETDR